jgi:cobalt/nickel transport system ATP-binding protein
MHHNSISIENVSYTYPDGIEALKSINLQIRATERVALVGANGSGKSTLLQHLNGIILPQQGKIRVGKYEMKPEFLQEIRNFVGLVFQNPDDQLFMPTVWEDIAFGPLNQGIEEEELEKLCHQAMELVELDISDYKQRSASNLSGGEKKRVAIAGVLAMQPQILVLDEPSSQLDPRSRRQLINLLDSLPLTQLIATHDLDLALDLCDRTIVLSKGRIVRDSPTQVILSDRQFLEEHHLELPLSYSRPYCLLQDSPIKSKESAQYDSGKNLFRTLGN